MVPTDFHLILLSGRRFFVSVQIIHFILFLNPGECFLAWYSNRSSSRAKLLLSSRRIFSDFFSEKDQEGQSTVYCYSNSRTFSVAGEAHGYVTSSLLVKRGCNHSALWQWMSMSIGGVLSEDYPPQGYWLVHYRAMLAVLYSVIQYLAVMYSAIQYLVVLYSPMQYLVVLYFTMQFHDVLHCTVQQWHAVPWSAVLCYAVPCWTAMYSPTVTCSALQCCLVLSPSLLSTVHCVHQCLPIEHTPNYSNCPNYSTVQTKLSFLLMPKHLVISASIPWKE